MSRTILARRLVAVVALVGGFAASAFIASEAQARVKGPRLDSFSRGCGEFQDEYDQAVRELGAAQKGTQAQYDAALRRVQSLQAAWQNSPCERAFGSLIFYKPPVVNGKPGLPTLAPTIKPSNIAPLSTSTSDGRNPTVKPRSVLKKN